MFWKRELRAFFAFYLFIFLQNLRVFFERVHSALNISINWVFCAIFSPFFKVFSFKFSLSTVKTYPTLIFLNFCVFSMSVDGFKRKRANRHLPALSIWILFTFSWWSLCNSYLSSFYCFRWVILFLIVLKTFRTRAFCNL